MRISYNWLRDYIDLKIAPAKIVELLTMAGLPVESIDKIAGDYLFEIEVTANRPDCLSVIGIARELSAITGRKLKVPSFVIRDSLFVKKRKTKNEKRFTNHDSRITIKVEDRKLCPRYTARIIRGVKVKESPDWLKNRLEAMGLRPVNNVVDITNFCLFETGEPLHAFDLDKICGAALIIRKAKKGEKIVTIDGIERILDETNLVIADSQRPIAIAGVMGGLNTEVTLATKNLLLEAAYFDPISVRRTARRVGVSTDSSYRFERKVDLGNIVYSSNRASILILKTAGGEIGEFIDIGVKKSPRRRVDLRYSRLNMILGVDIAAPAAKKILNSLGLVTKAPSKDNAKIEVPSFRYDLHDEIDLIEEVSRIYGYDKIPTTIPNIVEEAARLPFDTIVAKKIRQDITGLGFDEIITHSLLARKLLGMANISNDGIVEIKNPLTSEQEVMRPSLVVGMLNSILWNINRKTKDLKLFELGNIYFKEKGRFVERRHLSIGITGQVYSSWAGGSRSCSFFDLKGAAEELFSELGIDSVSFKYAKDGRFSSSECARAEKAGEVLGILAEANRKILNNFDIKEKVFYLELDVDRLLKYVSLEKRFKELPKLPSIFRDISIIVGKEILNADVIRAIKSAGSTMLKDARLIDRYIGQQIPEGKVGLAYRLEYQSSSKTLEDKDVLDIHAKVLHELERGLSAKLR